MKALLLLALLCAACTAPRTRGWIGGEFEDGRLLAETAEPLRRAGLRTGDVLLTLDGKQATHRAIARCEPGTLVEVEYSHAGKKGRTHVRVGEETYRRAGTLTVGLALSSRLDLWPFDDGIDVFGLLRLRRRDVFVLPVGVAWHDETISTLP